MKARLIKAVPLVLAALLLLTSPSWAKSKGYCYIIGYSLTQKTAFFSPIIMQKVKSTSYSEEEYVTDVELLQALESQFQKFLAQTVNLDAGRYTISARGAYKSNDIADEKLKSEMTLYQTKDFAVKIAKDFKFED